MKSESFPQIYDVRIAEAVIASEDRYCFLGEEMKKSEQPKQMVSCTGGIFWGKAGEKWPRNADGEPLIPWLQVVCKEIKGGMGAFYKKRAVCFFISREVNWEADSGEDGCDFVVREYLPEDKLVPLERPAELKGQAFHQVNWKQVLDFPDVVKYKDLFDEEVLEKLRDKQASERYALKNHTGIKIGGWPSPMQGPQHYPGSCEIQIDVTENFMWGDTGIGYLSRSGLKWHVYFESC